MNCCFMLIVLEKIFGKKSKIKILRFLMGDAQREYCLDDITKSIEMSCGTVYPSLKELLETRIITQRKIGRSILYKMNKTHTLFNSIRELIEAENNSLLDVSREFTSKLTKNNISAVVLFGSIARGDFDEKSDIDILIVENDNRAREQVRKLVEEILEMYDVHIVPVFLTKKEIEERIRRFDSFIITVMNEGHLLYGEASWLEK